MLLDKAGKEKDELRDLNYQFKSCINHFQASVCALKEIFRSCSLRIETVENQMQNLFLQLAELQCKLNFQPHGVSAIKVRA